MKITRTVGHDKDGTPIKRQFYGKSKRECQKKYEKWLCEDHNIINVDKKADEFMELFLKDSKYAIGTRNLYYDVYKRYIRGHATNPQALYNRLEVTASTLDTIHKVMTLVYNGIGETLNVVIPDKPVKENSDIVIWEEEYIVTIERELKDHPLFLAIELALYGGLRVSEILGLKFSDLSGGKINVNRQYYRGNFSPPKANSVRSVPMHDKVSTALSRHIELHKHGEYVFMTSTGNMIDYHNFTTSLSRAYRRIGVMPKKFHAYRATFCTNLCRNGTRLEIASKLMGHKSVNVTAKYYRFIDEIDYENAIKSLQKWLK